MVGGTIFALLCFIFMEFVVIWQLARYLQSAKGVDPVQLQQMHDDTFLEIYDAMGVHAASIIQARAGVRPVMKQREPTPGMRCHGCGDWAPCNGEPWWFEDGSRGRVLCPFCHEKETK